VGWFVVSAATLQFLIPALAVLSDAGHLVGVGLWVGGLAGIVAVRSLFRESEAAPLARIVLGRFSRLAAYAVGMILGGGVILALLLVGSWETLLGTPYGWVVLGKIALFAPMVSVGAFNRFRLIPKTVEEPVATDAVRRLVSNVRFETALGIAVLLLAGLLTSMQTAAVAAGPTPFALDAPADDLRVHLLVDPYPSAPGIYVFTTTLFDAVTGAPFDAEAHNTTGRITLTLLNSPLPPSTANLSGPHYPNHFFQTVTLSQRGVWRADVTYSRSDAFDVRATFHVPLEGGG
jgi:copper transport protein